MAGQSGPITVGTHKNQQGQTIPNKTGGPGGGAPWYTYPRVDNIGSPDPYGGFPKPDSNVQLPAGYPVTALLSGTVTNVDTSSDWGCAITIKLDSPLNSLATHTAYLHLGGVSVKQGQHVNAGDLIGVNGSSSACGGQKVPLGFALYSGDKYGSGSAWQTLMSNVTGLLNPVPVLNAAKGGTLSATAYQNAQGQLSQSAPGTNCAPWDISCWWTGASGNLASWGEHIAVFVIALLFIIAGLVFLVGGQKLAAAAQGAMPTKAAPGTVAKAVEEGAA
jgi:hypothetical protein